MGACLQEIVDDSYIRNESCSLSTKSKLPLSRLSVNIRNFRMKLKIYKISCPKDIGGLK